MNLRKSLMLFFLGAVSFSCSVSNKELPTGIIGKVIRIKDGDTIEILYDGKPLIVRLAHVDCPEIKRNQPFGKAAKQFTSDLCFGDIVTVENENKFDRYDRLIGVIINSKCDTVNLELVKAGLAWHYKQYSSNTLYSETETRTLGRS
jgi:micrococcal nuclease